MEFRGLQGRFLQLSGRFVEFLRAVTRGLLFGQALGVNAAIEILLSVVGAIQGCRKVFRQQSKQVIYENLQLYAIERGGKHRGKSQNSFTPVFTPYGLTSASPEWRTIKPPPAQKTHLPAGVSEAGEQKTMFCSPLGRYQQNDSALARMGTTRTR